MECEHNGKFLSKDPKINFGYLLAPPSYEKAKYVLCLMFASKLGVCLLDVHSKTDSSLDGKLT